MSNVPSIVLTGGPGGGKTTLKRELRANDPHARRWLLVPEAAPLLFQTGLNGRKKLFQRAVVHLQKSLEQICAEATNQDQILVCHRGALDALAYWLHNGWEEHEFFKITSTTREEYLWRYTGVIHLQTTAIGAVSHYSRWPDAHRPETIDQAAEIDRLCVRAWEGHSRYVLIENAGQTWAEKAEVARSVMTNWLL